jgi:hypothetical protein
MKKKESTENPSAKTKSRKAVTLGSVKGGKNKGDPGLTKGSCSLGPYDWFWGCSCERVKPPTKG